MQEHRVCCFCSRNEREWQTRLARYTTYIYTWQAAAASIAWTWIVNRGDLGCDRHIGQCTAQTPHYLSSVIRTFANQLRDSRSMTNRTRLIRNNASWTPLTPSCVYWRSDNTRDDVACWTTFPLSSFYSSTSTFAKRVLLYKVEYSTIHNCQSTEKKCSSFFIDIYILEGIKLLRRKTLLFQK